MSVSMEESQNRLLVAGGPCVKKDNKLTVSSCNKRIHDKQINQYITDSS